MATTNPALTTSYQKIVDAGDEFLLTLPFTASVAIDVAVADTESAPADTVIGHRLSTSQHEALNRSLTGPGYVYARAVDRACTVALTAWTP